MELDGFWGVFNLLKRIKAPAELDEDFYFLFEASTDEVPPDDRSCDRLNLAEEMTLLLCWSLFELLIIVGIISADRVEFSLHHVLPVCEPELPSCIGEHIDRIKSSWAAVCWLTAGSEELRRNRPQINFYSRPNNVSVYTCSSVWFLQAPKFKE